MRLEPRPYQTEMIDGCRRAVTEEGLRKILLVLPTGGGKTVVFIVITSGAVSKGKRALILAHRRELIHQPYDRMVDSGVPEEQIGIIMAGDKRYRPGAPIQIGSIDTLRHRSFPEADIVIIDEAHRSLAPSYVRVIDYYHARGGTIIGTTASPIRLNGDGLGQIYERIVLGPSYTTLVNLGFLVAPRVFTVPAAELPDLAAVRSLAGEYDAKELEKVVDRKQLVGSIVEHWKRRCSGVPTLCFAVSVKHSQSIAEEFIAAGIRAEHVDGKTDKSVRDAALRRLASGETQVICNCDVFCEGTDVPAVKCAILARPTKSLRVFLQQVGRGSRPYKGLPYTILDHAGCVVAHQMPQDDRVWSLEARKKKKRDIDDGPACKTCPTCFAIVPAAQAACGAPSPTGAPCPYVWPEASRAPLQSIGGVLIEVPAATTEEKRAAWEAWQANEEQRGYKSGWSFHRFLDAFGHKPPRDWMKPKKARPDAPVEEKARKLHDLHAEAARNGYRPGWVAARYRAEFGEEPPTAFQLMKTMDRLNIEPPPKKEDQEWTF